MTLPVMPGANDPAPTPNTLPAMPGANSSGSSLPLGGLFGLPGWTVGNQPTGPGSAGGPTDTSTFPVDDRSQYTRYGIPSILQQASGTNNGDIVWATADEVKGKKIIGLDGKPITGTVKTTALTILKQLAVMATDTSRVNQLMSIKSELYNAGFYGDGSNGEVQSAMLNGMYTADYSAMFRALEGWQQAAGAGSNMSFSAWLSQRADANKGQLQLNGAGTNGTGSSTAQTPQITLTDPQTLTSKVQTAAQAALGRNLSADQVQAFINAYHSQETSDQQSAMNGSTYIQKDPLSGAASAASDFVQQNNPKEYTQYQAQGYMDSFLNMFLPASSAAPNIQPQPAGVA